MKARASVKRGCGYEFFASGGAEFVKDLSGRIYATVTIACTSVHQLALLRCGVIEPRANIHRAALALRWDVLYNPKNVGEKRV
jgi:hypothetical protein